MKKDIDNLIRTNIKNLTPYSSARDEYQGDQSNMIFLDANENPYNNGVNRYPDPNQILVKEKLALIHSLAEEQILLGNGSDEIIDLIIRVFCEPNKDSMLTLPPTYGMYKVIAGINAIDTIEVSLTKEFQPDIDQILSKASKKSKILFLCSPNNPTGNSFDSKIIEKLIREFQGIVVIDEAYIDFSKRPSWINKLRSYPNLIIIQTLSKAYGMAGIRLGICFASSLIIETLSRIKPPYNVNELTQKKALVRLNGQAAVETEVKRILDERNKLFNELQKINIVMEVFPSDANFLLGRVDNAQKRYDQLLKKGIVVRNRSNEQLCKNCLRFTVGTSTENKLLVNALKSLI